MSPRRANLARLAWRLLWRDQRAGELRVFVAALVLATASVGTVGFFTDRVKSALAGEANTLLGADLMISGDRALPPSFAAEAAARGLATTAAIRFNSMVQRSDGTSAILADVKSIDRGYPLRGVVTLADPARSEGRPADGIPARGDAWIDTRLAARLGAAVGTRVTLGDASLRVAAIVQQDPEVVGGLLSLGPRIIVNVADVAATNLLQPGNRAVYRLLVAGPGVDAFKAWATPLLERGQRLETIRDLRPEVRTTLDRAESFLGLASLVAVILAAVAVALAASRYLRRHLDAAAMMRCFGASERQALVLFVLQFFVLGVIATLAGCVLALGGQALLAFVLASVFTVELPAPHLMPALEAAATGLFLLFGFALPPLVALSRVPPLRVLRRDLGLPRAGGVAAYGLGACVIALLIGWQAHDATTGLIMVGGVAGLIVATAASAWLLIVALRRIPQRAYSWRYGLANLRRRPLASSLQIGALGLGVMALLLLTIVRGDLVRNWRASLPPDAPDIFLINVLPDQVDAVAVLLRREAKVEATMSPMVRGRLVAINDRAVAADQFPDERARRLADREFNLSWSETLPGGNRITSGTWWTAQSRDGISLEQGIARTLGVKLDDQLTFDIAGTRITGRLASLRKVDWDSFRVNFFALFPPGVLDPMPKSYITAFRTSPASGATWLAPLVQQFPNILVIDVGEILQQVQRIMDQVARAVEFVFVFTLLGGLLVLEAAIAATQDERRYDAAVLRTLGASERQLRAAQLAEFVTLGTLAGLIAAAGATAVGYVLADRVFQIPFSWNPWVWVIGIGGGASCITLAGWLGTRATLRQPPLEVFRQLG